MDADFSPEHRKFVEEHPEVLTEGYTTTPEHPKGADYYWICEPCLGDFEDRFGWTINADS